MKCVQFGDQGRLFLGDCLNVMERLPHESIDLIYVDPPFFTGHDHKGRSGAEFEDRWEGGMNGYLDYILSRLRMMRKLLKATGSVYVHLDWRASHYVKVGMDEIFGYENFLNEIVWSFRSPGNVGRHFGRKHHVLFYYAKQKGLHVFNESRGGEYATKGILVDDQGRPFKRWKGKVCYYDERGPALSDVWDIPILSTVSKKFTGYPTQKPDALLDRIVLASTNEGDTVADFFCGSGTTLVSAQRHKRRWIGCDISRDAIKVATGRLREMSGT